RSPRIATEHSHGTGCALSAAIAAHLARGASLQDAVARAKALVTAGLQHPVVHGGGRGFPGTSPLARPGGLYVLTDAALRPDRSHEEIARAALDGGACAIQLREKNLPAPRLIELARRLREMAHERGALFLVNDRVDVALATDADGVHLGP